jgi:hexosaminidase
MTPLILLPSPREVQELPGVHSIVSGRRILIEGADLGELLFTAGRLCHALHAHAGVDWELTATSDGPLGEIGVALRVRPGASARLQGYQLAIREEEISVEAATPTGLFYGVCTLIQILKQSNRQLSDRRLARFCGPWGCARHQPG